MPVTARLSKLFYDRLGEEVTNELVDWFNQVDATYRADLRELNELNFARFDAKLEQHVAGLDAKLAKNLTEIQVGMLRWMFGFWLGTILPLAGLMLALNKL